MFLQSCCQRDWNITLNLWKVQKQYLFFLFLTWKDGCVLTWNRHWAEQKCAMWVHHGNNLPMLTLHCSLFLRRFLCCHRASLKVGCSVSWHLVQSDWCTSVPLYLGRSETRLLARPDCIFPPRTVWAPWLTPPHFDNHPFLFFIITPLPCPLLSTLGTCCTEVNKILCFHI